MDQLVNLVVEKTGISEQHARTAVETVLGYLKQRLPAPIAGQIDSALSGSGSESGGLGGAAKKLGGMLGK
jgi:uncharacterized protein (DUF2267 family)